MAQGCKTTRRCNSTRVRPAYSGDSARQQVSGSGFGLVRTRFTTFGPTPEPRTGLRVWFRPSAELRTGLWSGSQKFRSEPRFRTGLWHHYAQGNLRFDSAFFAVRPFHSVTFCVEEPLWRSQKHSGCRCKDVKWTPNAVATRPRDVPHRPLSPTNEPPSLQFVLHILPSNPSSPHVRPFPICSQVPRLIAPRSLWSKTSRSPNHSHPRSTSELENPAPQRNPRCSRPFVSRASIWTASVSEGF